MNISKKIKSLDLTLFRNIFNYGIGSILPQLIGFITLPIFSRYLSPEDYGTLEIIYYFNLFITILMRIGLPGVVSRFYYDHGEGQPLKEYISTIYWTVIVSSILVGVFAGIGLYIWEPAYLREKNYFIFGLIPILTAILNANSDIQRRLIQARQQSKYSMYLSFAITLAGVVVAYPFIVTFKMGAKGSLIANLIITIIFFIQAQYYLSKDVGFIFRKNLMPESVKYAFGVLPSHIINNIIPFVNRVYFSQKVSVAALANLSLANRFGSFFILFSGALQNAFLPQYFALRKESNGHEKLARLNKVIWYFSCLSALAFCIFSPYVIKLLLPPRYHGASTYFPIFAVGFLGQVFYTLHGQEIFYNKKTKLSIWITVASVIPNLAIVRFLSNKEEAYSIAWGVTIGQICSALVGCYLSSRFIRLNLSNSEITVGLLTGSVLIFIYFSQG